MNQFITFSTSFSCPHMCDRVDKSSQDVRHKPRFPYHNWPHLAAQIWPIDGFSNSDSSYTIDTIRWTERRVHWAGSHPIREPRGTCPDPANCNPHRRQTRYIADNEDIAMTLDTENPRERHPDRTNTPHGLRNGDA